MTIENSCEAPTAKKDAKSRIQDAAVACSHRAQKSKYARPEINAKSETELTRQENTIETTLIHPP